MTRRHAYTWAFSLLTVLASTAATAHETDQFLMPPDANTARFADMGRYFSDYFGQALRDGVETANRKIARSEARSQTRKPVSVGGRKRRTISQRNREVYNADYYRSPRGIADAVRGELPDAMTIIEGLEWSPPDMTRYGYQDTDIVIYKPQNENAMHTDLHFILDPRIVGRLWRAGTFQAYGIYMGGDKIGHFVDMGYRYFQVFDRHRRAGASAELAAEKAVDFGVNDPTIGENALLGRLTAGAYSNADLAANYVGMLFYRNLTEPVTLGGKTHPPMLELTDAGTWKLADYIDNDPDFFRAFLSNHFNEALNPSHFEKGMQHKVRKAIAHRWYRVAQWYTDERGTPRSRNWFNQQAQNLATYHGQNYGHCRVWDELFHLGNVAPEGEAPDSLALDR